jgi:DNA polymerase V
MCDAGIDDGDVLVVDRSLTARSGDIAVCFIDNAFTVKRLRFAEGVCYLVPANPRFPTVRVEEGQEFRVWGVVTYVIKNVR